MIKCIADGSVELYEDGVKKFETTSDGVQITGHSYQGDDNKGYFGNAQDLQIYHDATDSYIKNTTNDLIVECTGDDVHIKAADDVFLKVQGSEAGIDIHGDAGVSVYYDGSKKLETSSTGVNITGTLVVDEIDLGSSEKINLGASDALQIWSDGSDSIIRHTKSGSGQDLILESDTTTIIGKTSVNGGDVGVKFIADGAVELYYDAVKKFETTANGATVTGHISGAHGVIEQFFTPCDGSAIALVNGTETVSDITSATSMSTTFADIPGSEIAYTPPSGTKQVIYKFVFTNSRDGDSQSRAHFKLLIDGTEVTNARWSDGSGGSAGIDRYNNFEWAINVGGTANAATGRQASWTSDKTIKLQMREYTSGYESKVHNVYYWDGANNDPQFHQPSIGITAIG